MSNESMNQKIIKLLKLAERAGTPAEAEAASRAAERLMLKLGIEEAVLRSQMTNGEKPEAIVTKRVVRYHKHLINGRAGVGAGVIRGMGNLRSYLQPDLDGGKFHMVMGFESDVDRAAILINSILLQADRALATWWKSAPEREVLSSSRARRAKRQFLFSFASVVERRLREMYREEVAESAARGTGAELVLVNRDAQVQAEFEKVNLRKPAALKGTWAGQDAGRAAGARANLGAKGIGGTRGELGG